MDSPESYRNFGPLQGTGSRNPEEAVRQYRTLSIKDKGYSFTSDLLRISSITRGGGVELTFEMSILLTTDTRDARGEGAISPGCIEYSL